MQTRIGALPAFTLLALCCQPAWAGGILLYEVGTDNVGLANAGAAARAQGPSTIASNPAGMSYLPGTQITAQDFKAAIDKLNADLWAFIRS